MKKSILWPSIFVLVTCLSLYPVTSGALKSTGFASCDEAKTLEMEAPGSSPSLTKEPSSPAPGTVTDTNRVLISSRGNASFYTVSTNGVRTASGVPLNDSVSTAAHRTLPFGTRVRVTNLSNARNDIVKITDRGPFIKNRIIDVSQNAAEKLGMIEAGIIAVEIEILPEALKPLQTPLAKE